MTIFTWGNDYIFDTALTDFPGLKQVSCIRKKVYRNGYLVSEEHRYQIPSLSRKKLLGGIRGHWQIENSLHHVKDRSWHEDKMYSINPEQGWILGKLRNQAPNILRHLSKKRRCRGESLPKLTARLQSQPMETLRLVVSV